MTSAVPTRRHFRVVLAAATCTAAGAASSSAQTIPAQQGRIWNSSFINEFNAGASDLTGFMYDVGNNGWGNNELQNYTAPAGSPPPVQDPFGIGMHTTPPTGTNSANVYVQNGALNISAIATGSGAGQTYTSGRIKTTNLFTQAYGLFEFRAKMPFGQGLWPAVWMLPKNNPYGGWPTSGEIDLLETKGQDPGLVQGTLHSGASPGQAQFQTRTFQQSGLRPPGFTTNDWHTYSVEWRQGSPNVAATFKWYVDGVNYFTQQGGWHIPAGVPSTNDDAPFDKPFYFLINMAVGGNYVGAPNIAAGTYTMQLDFLRAYASSLRPTWKNDQSGNWSDATKWTDSIVPNALDSDVLFGGIISQSRTVTVNVPVTAGKLTFENNSSYVLVGSQTITLNTSGADAAINVVSGSHAIQAPVNLARTTRATVTPPAGVLTMSGGITAAAGTTFTKAGPGTLQARHVRGSALSVEAGTLRMLSTGGHDGGVSNVGSLAILPDSSLDLTDNGMVINYPNSGGSPIDSIRALLQTGRATGDWSGSGLTSSTAQSVAANPADPRKTAIGYGEALALGLTEFMGQFVDDDALLIRYTLLGDSNLSGGVDLDDFNTLASNFGTSGKHWFEGDFDFDGLVDLDDFNLLAGNFGFSIPAPPPLMLAVPEPGATVVLLTALSGILARRRPLRR